MSETSNPRKVLRTARPAAATIVLAALLMTGCASPSAPTDTKTADTNAADAAVKNDPSHLDPSGDFFDPFFVVPAPLMDSSAHFTGEIASAPDTTSRNIYITDKPNGKPISVFIGMKLPVIEHATAPAPASALAEGWPTPDGEWIRVILPSMVAMPTMASADVRPHVNEGTGWVWGGDATITNPKTHITINKVTQAVSVGPVDGAPTVTFPAKIGADVPDGSTFMARHSVTQRDGKFGDVTDCFGNTVHELNAVPTDTELTFRIAFMSTDRCPSPNWDPDFTKYVQLAPADLAQFAKYDVPGTPVEVIAGGQGS